MKEMIEKHIKLSWSPEQIVGRLYQGLISFKSIYRWIYKGLLSVSVYQLRQKGKRQKPYETRGRFNIGTSISKRPKEAKNRHIFGHWELDTVVSGRCDVKGCVATFVERKTRFYSAILMKDRSATSMKQAIKVLYNKFNYPIIKTATTDRGKEFSCYKEIEDETPIKFYFADAYASWQRGSNENSNGLFREFFPKKTNFDHVTQEQINEAFDLINRRPRKCLGWRTALEMFEYELVHLN